MNQTRPHCVNQDGKTHSKPLAARHGRGTAWARHALCESAFRCTVHTASKYIQTGFLLVNFSGSNLCFLSLDPHDSHCAGAVGFTFTIVICVAILKSFM